MQLEESQNGVHATCRVREFEDERSNDSRSEWMKKRYSATAVRLSSTEAAVADDCVVVQVQSPRTLAQCFQHGSQWSVVTSWSSCEPGSMSVLETYS